MKKKLFKFTKLLALLMLVFQFNGSAQSPRYLIISGKLISDSEKCENITVQIIKNNQKAAVSIIPETRRFRLELDYNSEYQLIFNQNGFLAKTILVNTKIPGEIIQREINFPHFLMAVKLERAFDEAESLNASNLIQRITYSPENDNFSKVPTIFDIEYVEQNSLYDRQSMKSSDSRSKFQTYQIF